MDAFESVRTIDATCEYQNGTHVSTNMGPGFVIDFRPSDGVYTVELEWELMKGKKVRKEPQSALATTPLAVGRRHPPAPATTRRHPSLPAVSRRFTSVTVSAAPVPAINPSIHHPMIS